MQADGRSNGIFPTDIRIRKQKRVANATVRRKRNMEKQSKKTYRYLIFDADHTLLDYTADEREAFIKTYGEIDIPVQEELLRKSHFFFGERMDESGPV